MRRYLLVVVTMWLVSSAPAPVGACVCVSSSDSPCVAAWRADAVFVGVALEVSVVESPLAPDSPLFGREARTRMSVTEAFRGVTGPHVDVYTLASSTCAFGFELGVPYLVYAGRTDDGRLTTGLCSSTRRVTAASQDLADLRAMVQFPPALASIMGKARVSFVNTPLEGVSVIAESDGGRYETRTGHDGEYTLSVPRGSYRVTYDVGAGLHASEARVDVVHEGSCLTADVAVRPDGRVNGRVVDGSGMPVANMTVFLANAEAGAGRTGAPHHAVTDTEGVYHLVRLAPGQYIVGMGMASHDQSDGVRVFHPGVTDRARATTVTIGLGEARTLADLVVPPDVQLFTLTGTVRNLSGAAVAGATVWLAETYVPRASTRSATRVAVQPVMTDSYGRFAFTALAGRYSLTATPTPAEQQPGRTVQLDALEGTGQMDVTVLWPD